MAQPMEPQRPLPEPNEVTAPFWDAAARHELIHPHCQECERAFFPPHLACPHCRATRWSWVTSAGRGTLYSFTVVHRAPQPGFEVPYVIGVVDLDEGFDLMTNIVGVAPEAVRIGARVTVDWLDVSSADGGAGMVLPVFRLDEHDEHDTDVENTEVSA